MEQNQTRRKLRRSPRMKLFVSQELVEKGEREIWGEWWPERSIAIGVSQAALNSERSRLICYLGSKSRSDSLVNVTRTASGFSSDQPDLSIFTFDAAAVSTRNIQTEYADDVSFALYRARSMSTRAPEQSKLRTGFTLVLAIVSHFVSPIVQPLAHRFRWACLPSHAVASFKGIRRLPALLHAGLSGDSAAQFELNGRLLLSLLDFVLGLVAIWFIIFHPLTFVLPIERAYVYLNRRVLVDLVQWLTGSPAGLQMNKNLASFLGTISVTTVDLWHSFVVVVGNIGAEFNVWKILFALTACGGLSSLLAALVDTCSFLFFHIYFQYVGVTRLWATGISAIRTMFLLFRGKKMNILKQRVDGHSFDLEQLLLGTVFFSMFVFLVPTAFVFYVAHTIAWLSVVCMQLCLWAAATSLTEFPLLQFLQSRRGELRSGVFLEAVEQRGGVPVLRVHGRKMGAVPVVRKFQAAIFAQIPLDLMKTAEAVIWGSSVVRLHFRAKSATAEASDPEEEARQITQLGKQLLLGH